MKKVFKASLVAASLAGAFAANAASISSTPVQLSTEGLAVGLDSTAAFSFDVVVDKLHPAASEITLTLSDDVDLTGLTGGACTNNPGTGLGDCGDILFNYGTGSFTFDSVAIDTDDNTITFNVNLGNPLTASSAFRVTVGDTNLPTIAGASTVAYSSETSSGTAIETGSGVIAEEVTQYTLAVDTELDGVIEREERTEFVRNFVTGSNGLDDTLVLEFGDKAADVVNPAFANGTVVTIKGDFSDAVVHAAANWVSAEGATVVRVNATTLTATYTEAQWDAAAAAGEDTITFSSVATLANPIDPSSFTVSATQSYSSLTAGAGTVIATPASLLSNADAGEWELDAAVINVPYLPVGYAQFSSNVEVSNLGTTDADIIVEAVGKTGVKYGPVTLSKVAKKGAVTTVFEGDLMTAFGLSKGSDEKLSVTFIIDADADKVTLAPYYREGTARVNVVSDQYKADDIR
ncbi:hypothetical protein [Rheinheimera sp.]|uniref:hypothetical protein n=1 Tax=Rheinheimera sp. TaxID=1869214 RepID=UPI00307F0182